MVEPCWDIKNCPNEKREKCPAWELQGGHLCWFINGTVCEGKVQKNWKTKMETCKEADKMTSKLPGFSEADFPLVARDLLQEPAFPHQEGKGPLITRPNPDAVIRLADTLRKILFPDFLEAGHPDPIDNFPIFLKITNLTIPSNSSP
jgi:hypothetical protein